MPTADFTKMVPGFDFLQGLMKNAGAGVPGMSQWIAPSLDPEEIDKRINELRTVQFWLEQNARLLGATIQALEVQKMTLSTLKSMNLPLADLHDSMKIRLPEAAAAVPEPATQQAASSAAAAEPQGQPSFSESTATGGADPMQWWTALTRQFTDLAANAMKEGGPARQMAEALVKAPAETLAQVMRPQAGAAKTGARPAAAGKPAARKAAPAKAAKRASRS